MKTKHFLSLALAFMLAALPGCGSTQNGSSSADSAGQPSGIQDTSFTVTDMMGGETTFDAPAQRVVVLTAGECEILYAIGGESTVVGRGEYCNYPEAVNDVTSVQSGYETNVEQLLALNPDVVVMNSMAQSLDIVTTLREAGVPVIVTTASDIDGIYESIQLLGDVIGHTEEAAALIEQMQDEFAALAASVPESSGKTVYFEVSPLEYGLWTAGTTTFMDELATLLGVENAFSDVTGWAEISQEQVLQRDPDYIITNAMSYDLDLSPVDEILARPGWENLSAVENDHVYNVDADTISRPGPRLTDAAQELYEAFYG